MAIPRPESSHRVPPLTVLSVGLGTPLVQIHQRRIIHPRAGPRSKCDRPLSWELSCLEQML